jgi:surface antigen
LGGTLPPGEYVDVPVHFNAIVVNPGTYRCTLKITCNDPDNPVVKVPVELTVEDVRGTVCGYVFKACGDAGSDICLPPVESAYVEVLDSAGAERVSGSGYTDHWGYYSIPALGLGTYLVRVQKPGHVEFQSERGQLACPGQTSPPEPVEFVNVGMGAPGKWPYGTPLGSFMGVTAYSNKGMAEVQLPGEEYGDPYECVEYVRRFYRQALFQGIPFGYNADQFFPNAAALGLDSFDNSTSAPPHAGDIICWSVGHYGHVAIVETVINKPPDNSLNDTVYITQQNVQDNYLSCHWPLLAEIRSNGSCSLSTKFQASPSGCVTQGWLRRRNLPADPFANMVFVDDNWSNASGSAFSYFGNPLLWHEWAKGQEDRKPIGTSRNRMLYVNSRATAPVNYAIWRPNLPSDGRYEVFAFIPSQHATTRHARYSITASTSRVDTVVDESTYSAQYVSLGTYDFHKGIAGYVRLTDSTGETNRQVAFDALLFVKRSGGLMEASGCQAQPVVVEPGEVGLEVRTVVGLAGRVPIRYSIPREDDVKLAVYDANGRRVAVLADGRKRPGCYESAWDSRGHASGVYFCMLTADRQRVARKLLLVR